MVRENWPGYGPMGALRAERVTKPDGRYVLYYSWPDRPAEAGVSATRTTTDDGSDSTGRPADGAGHATNERAQTPVSGRDV